MDALPLVDDLYDALWYSKGLRRLRAVLRQAARNLSEENWAELRRKMSETFHQQDELCFDRLFADAEPLWRRCMEATTAAHLAARKQGPTSSGPVLAFASNSGF